MCLLYCGGLKILYLIKKCLGEWACIRLIDRRSRRLFSSISFGKYSTFFFSMSEEFRYRVLGWPILYFVAIILICRIGIELKWQTWLQPLLYLLHWVLSLISFLLFYERLVLFVIWQFLIQFFSSGGNIWYMYLISPFLLFLVSFKIILDPFTSNHCTILLHTISDSDVIAKICC